jgi:hypothetical protein
MPTPSTPKTKSGRPVQASTAPAPPRIQPQWSGYGMTQGAQGSGMAPPKAE